jgi:hypothetical protein
MIVFFTGPGTRLRSVAATTVLAFEGDRFDEATETGRSVMAVGIATEIKIRRSSNLLLPRSPAPELLYREARQTTGSFKAAVKARSALLRAPGTPGSLAVGADMRGPA